MRILIGLAMVCIIRSTFAQGMESGSNDPARLKQLEKAWVAAQALLAKHPHDPKVREKFVVAGVRFGYETEFSPLLASKLKYRQALLIYKKVLQVDPRNRIAADNSAQIIRIYKSLGRPIPK